MPIGYLRNITTSQRTQTANAHLGLSLTFVAGAANAGGFLAMGTYTSHMTGIVAAMADDLALAQWTLVLGGLGALLSFLLGAGSSAILVNWGRRRGLQSAFALPLALEAILLMVFGLMGARLTMQWVFVPATVAVLSYVMGLQNAIITKISNAEIRTTHVTGIVTDLGIELGKWLYWNRQGHRTPVIANRPKLRLLSGMLFMFFFGGVAGALGFSYIGYVATLPLAFMLLVLAAVPILDDVRAPWRAG